MTPVSFIRNYRMEILLSAILLLSAFLNLWNIWNQGYSNAYYAAAVKSMLSNPGMLFFNSFDAGGFVTVDKPPLGLWVQALSASLFGFSGWALVLPQALAGIGSVALLYAIVSRPFGRPAGLVAALALAITPIFVAVARNGTMDSQLIFVLLLAVWIALKAARDHSLPCLLLAAIIVGLGFNIKMIQAFIAVPAVLGIYLLGAAEIPWKKRLLHIGFAIAILAAVSLSWAVAVDLVPADQRPYIGGSGDNTVLGLIINYNGLHRLENGMLSAGGNGGPGQGFPGGIQPGSAPSRNQTPEGRDGPVMQDSGNSPMDRLTPPQGDAGRGMSPPQGGAMPGGRTGGGMMDESGSPGPFRLFESGLAGQIIWLLPFALIGLLAILKRPKEFSPRGFEEAGYFSERGLVLLGLCLWLFPGLLYFSFTTGFWHTYYLATIAPPLAGLAGISAVALYTAYLREGQRKWLLVAAVLVTGFTTALILSYHADWSGILLPAIALGGLGFTALLAFLIRKKTPGQDRLPKIAAACAIGLLFIAPLVWACTPILYGSGGILPVAGPQLARDNGGGPGGSLPGSGGNSAGLAGYLVSHRTGERWIVAVQSSMDAANLILSTDQPVMALGGFAGSDQVLTTDSLRHLISQGKIRFFFLGSDGGGPGRTGGNRDITSWVGSHCTIIPASGYGGTNSTAAILETGGSGMFSPPAGTAGTPGPGQGSRSTLYDCRGATGQAADAAGS